MINRTSSSLPNALEVNDESNGLIYLPLVKESKREI